MLDFTTAWKFPHFAMVESNKVHLLQYNSEVLVPYLSILI